MRGCVRQIGLPKFEGISGHILKARHRVERATPYGANYRFAILAVTLLESRNGVGFEGVS